MRRINLMVLVFITLTTMISCEDDKNETPNMGEKVQIEEGKYLMMANKKGEKEEFPTALPVNISKDKLSVIEIDEDNNNQTELIEFAKIQYADSKINMTFSSIFKDLSDGYIVKKEDNGYSLSGEKNEISLSYFKTDVDKNKKMGIVGKWVQNEGTKLTLEFKLPNIVHLSEQSQSAEESFASDYYAFWGVYPNGKDIFITAGLLNILSGNLKNVIIKDNILHFDYREKHYAMQRN